MVKPISNRIVLPLIIASTLLLAYWLIDLHEALVGTVILTGGITPLYLPIATSIFIIACLVVAFAVRRKWDRDHSLSA